MDENITQIIGSVMMIGFLFGIAFPFLFIFYLVITHSSRKRKDMEKKELKIKSLKDEFITKITNYANSNPINKQIDIGDLYTRYNYFSEHKHADASTKENTVKAITGDLEELNSFIKLVKMKSHDDFRLTVLSDIFFGPYASKAQKQLIWSIRNEHVYYHSYVQTSVIEIEGEYLGEYYQAEEKTVYEHRTAERSFLQYLIQKKPQLLGKITDYKFEVVVRNSFELHEYEIHKKGI